MADNIRTIGSGTGRIYNSQVRLSNYNEKVTGYYTKKINAYTKKAGESSATANKWNVGQTIGNGMIGVGSAIGGAGWILSGIGALVSGVSSWFSSDNANDAADYQYYAQQASAKLQKYQGYMDALTTNLTAYGQSLENRDELAYNASRGLEDSITSMSNTYGAGFTSALRSIFYSANGIDSSITSIFNGNYSTFNNIGYGEVAGSRGGQLVDYSDLTDSAKNYFYGNYDNLELSDLNSKMTNKLYELIMTSGTSFAQEVGNYETEIKNLFSNALAARRNTIQQGVNSINSINSNYRSSNISTLLQIGKAQAENAVSGFRGASGSENVKLLELEKAMADMEYKTQVAYGFSQIQSALQNTQMQVAQKTAEYRNAEKLSLKKAVESAVSSWNQTVGTVREAERKANQELDEAYIYQKEMERNTESILNLVDGVGR